MPFALPLALPSVSLPAALDPLLPPASGLTLAIAGLTLFVAVIVLLFSRRYMRADTRQRSYYGTICALVASVLAFVATGNLLIFAGAWVSSGMLLARLIGHAGQLTDARLARQRAATSFAIGDAALVGALAILWWHAGTLRIDTALAAAATMPQPLALLAALSLVIAAAVRCALPPFSGWLQSSMTAPTPISALMHAGLVNAGGFLLIRFAPVMEAAPQARYAAAALGAAAALYGIGIMAVRPDIKRSLAGSTVSQMGFMILSCGLGAYTAALWHILAHGLFKASLFLGSGANVGMKPGGRKPDVDPRTAMAIAAATLIIALAAGWEGVLTAGMMPLALGLTTALASLTGILQCQCATRAKAMLALCCLGLIALYAIALRFSHAAMGTDAPALLPAPALLCLLAGFLGIWVWQQRRFAMPTPLPPALYVRLLNAGTLALPAKGAAQ